MDDTFEFPEPIWEIGSYCVPGQEELGNLRGLFVNRQYEGLDIRPGPGVDRVENVERLNTSDNSVGTILCLNTFEHVEDIFAGAGELHRVLKPDGMLVMTTPFNFPIHNHPGDYWRFSPQALVYLTRNFGTRLIGYHGDELTPRMTFVVAFKQTDSVGKLEGRITSIKEQLRRAFAPRKRRMSRRVRMALAKMLVDKKFFRNYDNFGGVDLWIVGPDGKRARLAPSETNTEGPCSE